MQDHIGLYGTIRDYLGPHGTIQDNMGPYETIQGYRGPDATLFCKCYVDCESFFSQIFSKDIILLLYNLAHLKASAKNLI